MRIATEVHLETNDGLLALCDGAAVVDFVNDETRHIEVPEGRYEVFAGQGFLVVNISPHAFDGSDWVDVLSVGHLDIPSGVLALLDGADLPNQAAEDSRVHFHRFSFRHLTAWLEQPEYQGNEDWDPFARILGVGAEARPILAGPHALEIHRMEKRLAAAMRAKGHQKQQGLAELRAEVHDMVGQGILDDRLRQIGSVLGVSVPFPKGEEFQPTTRGDYAEMVQKAKDAFLSAGLSADDDERAVLYERAATYFEWAEEIEPLPASLQEKAEKARNYARLQNLWEREMPAPDASKDESWFMNRIWSILIGIALLIAYFVSR